MDNDKEIIDEILIYFKEGIKIDVSRFMSAYEFEDFEGLSIYPKDKIIKIISKKIIKLSELLNRRNDHPFFVYNFTDGVFEEDAFIGNSFNYDDKFVQEITRFNLKIDTQKKLFILFRDTFFESSNKADFKYSSIYALYKEIKEDFFLSKKLEFLILKRKELTGDISIKDNLKKIDVNLQWYGNQSELIELIKALIENGNLKGNQKDIFNEVQKVFNFELNNIDQAITKFNERSQQTETKFLDKLKASLSKHISTKLNKNR